MPEPETIFFKYRNNAVVWIKMTDPPTVDVSPPDVQERLCGEASRVGLSYAFLYQQNGIEPSKEEATVFAAIAMIPYDRESMGHYTPDAWAKYHGVTTEFARLMTVLAENF